MTCGGRAVEGDARGTPGRVEVARHLDGDAAARCLDDDDVVARGEHEQVGEAAAQDRRRRSGGRARGHGDIGGERDAGGDRSVGQAGQELRRHLLGRGGVHEGAGDHGRHERSRRDGPAELFDDHDELGQSEARAAALFGQVEAQPAQGGQVVPERRESLGLSPEQGPGGAARIAFGQEVRGRPTQGAMVFGEGDRHG